MYLILFYLIALGFLIFSLQISSIVAIRNLDNNEHEKTFAYFKDNEKSYVSVRKYAETKKRYIAAKKKIAAM